MNNLDYNSEIFRGLIEKSSDLFCVTQNDYKIIDFNTTFQAFLGVEESDNFLFDFISPKYMNESNFTIESLNQSTQKLVFVHWEKMVFENNKQIFWLGKIDVAKQIESLEETGRMGKIGFWEYDVKNQTVFWSEEVYKIHEESISKTIVLDAVINYYHPDDVSIISNLFSKALTEGLPFEVELRIVTAKNNIKWIKSIGERVLENGKITKVKGTFQDIHRTKIAELESIQKTILLNQILDSLPIGVFWKDKNGVYKGFNKTSSDFIGLPIEKIIGKKDDDFIHNQEQLLQLQYQDQEVLKYQKVHTENQDVVSDKMITRSIELKKLPLFNEKNEVSGILGVYIDNTNQLINFVRSLKNKNNELNELLFVASHDLKEPLQGINRYAQLLKKRYSAALDLQGNQMLDYILRETKRQYEQFNGLTRFLEVGNQTRKIQKLNFNDIINDAINNLDLKLYDFPKFEIILDVLPKISFNKYDLEVLFYELINNAIKFRKPNELLIITISAIEYEQYWEITFTDNGQGFDIKLKDKVFMIFQKLHNKYYYEGAGIGLSICRKIVEHYGGQIEVQSEKSKGTTFVFSISKTK